MRESRRSLILVMSIGLIILTNLAISVDSDKGRITIPGTDGLKHSITERAGIQLSSSDYKPEVLKEIEYDLDKCKRDIKAAEILIACLSDIENFIVNSHFIEGLSWITISSKHKEKYNNCIHKALTIEQIKRINKKALKKSLKR